MFFMTDKNMVHNLQGKYQEIVNHKNISEKTLFT